MGKNCEVGGRAMSRWRRGRLQTRRTGFVPLRWRGLFKGGARALWSSGISS